MPELMQGLMGMLLMVTYMAIGVGLVLVVLGLFRLMDWLARREKK